MNKVKASVGYTEDMQSFFKYLNTAPEFFPFAEDKQVLDSFWGIKKAEEPQLRKLLTTHQNKVYHQADRGFSCSLSQCRV